MTIKHMMRRRLARVAVALSTAAVTGTLATVPAGASCPPGEDCGYIYKPRTTTTTAPALSSTSGTFKVAVDGFYVNRKTHDTWFDWDGKADEVFHKTRVNIVDPNGAILQSYDKSLYPDGRQILGDVNSFPSRIKAGSASDLGGIQSGDTVNQPLTLIQNQTLTKGGNKLAFTLSLNEWDNSETDWVGPWIDLLNANMGPLGKAVALFDPAAGAAVTTIGALGVPAIKTLHDLAPSSGTRPIGVVQTAAGSKDYTYNAPVIVLDFDKAAWLTSPSNFCACGGVLEVHLQDVGDGEGYYVLKVRVTRQS